LSGKFSSATGVIIFPGLVSSLPFDRNFSKGANFSTVFPTIFACDGHHLSIIMDHIARLHKDESDEMLCKVDSTESARSFEQNTTLS